MTKRIFISYRRDDSAGNAGRIFDRLKTEFGQEVLFMDVDAIPLGVNFVKVLREEVGRCDVLLAIIGPNWLLAKDDDGAHRLDNANDFVRVEIAAALARDIPVIPILLEGTRVPKAEALPHDLKELSQRNGLDVRHASFHSDMDKLVRGLRNSTVSSTAGVAVVPPIIPQPAPEKLIGGKFYVGGRYLTVDEVIAAAGQWALNLAPPKGSPPAIFSHFFMRIPYTRVAGFANSGTVMVGSRWHDNAPFFDVVHGPCGHLTFICETNAWLTHLGPQWRPEFLELSAAVFKKLGAKPLSHFITYPSKTPVPVKQ